MPIRVRQAPEPFTRDADRQPPLFASSDAYRRLHSALRRYVRREIGGRSFLISGHRGSGKTTLVLQAIWDIKRSAQATELVPLLVRLQGPDLLPDPELLRLSAALPDGAGEEPEGEPKEAANDGAGDVKDEGPETPAENRLPSQALAERALRQITIAIYRAASEAFTDAFARRVTGGDGAADGLPASERAEFAARFRLALDEAPSPDALRELYRLGGVLERGVFPSIGLGDPGGQGMRELAALASAAAAYRMVSGKVVSSRKESRSAEEERSRTFSLDPAAKDLVEKALILILGGGVGTAALTTGGQSPAVAGLVGVGAALAAATVLKFSGSRTRKRSASEEYTFLPDHDASTLERELPVLIGRLADAGLAPVFVVDELDKVGGLQERMRTVVSQLKQFVSERAFFCFLTDRDYFEHLRDRSLREPYPHEHTYFTDYLFVLHRPGDLHEYLDEVLDLEGTEPDDEIEKELLRFLLLHRSKMHPVDLRREIRRLSNADGYIALGGRPVQVLGGMPASVGTLSFDLGLRFAVMVQLAVEWLVARDPLRSRLEQDPHFAQPVYDALYYVSRTWERGGEQGQGGEESDGSVLDLSEEAFHRYMAARMNPNRPPPTSSLLDTPRRAGNGVPMSIPLSPRDREFLLVQVRELVSLMLEPDRLKEQLDLEPLSYAVAPFARDAIPAEAVVLSAIGEDRYAFQFDPYGRRLGLPPAAVKAEAAPEKAVAEAVTGPGAGERAVARTSARVPGRGEEKGEPTASKRAPRRDRQPVPIRNETEASVLREEARSAVGLAERMDGFVYDLVGMNLSTLAAIHVVSAVPPWTSVEEAIGRLGPYLEDGKDDPALAKDASLVTKAVDDLKRRSHLLAASLVYGTALAQAIDSPHEAERRTRGLTALSEGLRFQDRRGRTVLQRELERYRETVSGVYEDHADWPSLMDVDFAQWRDRVTAAMKSRTMRYEPSRIRLASESAWRSWKERLEKRAITGRAEIQVSEADLLCQVAGVPPATELRTDLEKMTIRDWSNAFLRGCGSPPNQAIADHAVDSQLDHRPRAWLAAAALIELGLGQHVESLLGTTAFDTRDSDEVRSWLRRIEQTRSRALQARQSSLIVYLGDEPTLSAGWLPSGRYGVLSWSRKGPPPIPVQIAVMRGQDLRPVGLIELPSGKAQPEVLRGATKALMGLGVTRDRVFFLTPEESEMDELRQAEGAEIIDDDDWGAPPIFGAQNLDDAMERALRYLNLPT